MRPFLHPACVLLTLAALFQGAARADSPPQKTVSVMVFAPVIEVKGGLVAVGHGSDERLKVGTELTFNPNRAKRTSSTASINALVVLAKGRVIRVTPRRPS